MSRRGFAYNYGTTSTSRGTAIPPPPQLLVGTINQSAKNRQSFSGMSGAKFLSDAGMDAITATMTYGMNTRKRQLDDGDDENDYLETDDEPSASGLDYIPAPDSPSAKKDSEEEDDPLDSFMATIEVEAKKEKPKDQRKKVVADVKVTKKAKLGRTDIEEEDEQESYFKWIEENPDKANAFAEEEDIEYDADGNPILNKKYIDPLPHIDHSAIDYASFERNFYEEHPDIAKLTTKEVEDLRVTLGVKVGGLNPPKPVTSFAHFGFDERLMNAIRKSEFSQPTPIQAQGIPIVASGRDIIGIAKTGSGKTVTYLWPALQHIMAQPELQPGDGPIVLICVPTRELAIQVYNEAKRFGKVFDLRVVCAYGGGSKWEQTKALQEGAEIVVCTPGRIIDHVKIKATNFDRVTFVVFDEADRMFDMGFEPQVRSIADHVRPDRQCLLFSATFKKRIERLARDVLTDPVKVVQGEVGEANEDVQQAVEVFSAGPEKWQWLTQRLVGFCTVGKVLIFVTRKQNAEELATNLKARDFKLGLLHGDMQQQERNEVLHSFRTKDGFPILVATDVAARGLDIHSIKTVINYDVARDIDTHVHRIGRTGRAGEKGYAVTLVTEKDKEFAGHLVRNLESVNQFVNPKLLELAMQSQWFKKSRGKHEKGAKPHIGGKGLGFKEGPATVPYSPASQPHCSSSSRALSSAPIGVKEAIATVKPGTERLSAMRAAYSNQYKSTFHVASAETNWETHAASVPISDPTPEWKQKLEEIKKSQEAKDNAKRKSRWN